MIRSSKLTTKFSNQQKQDNIQQFIYEYKNVVSFFINELWEMEKIPNLLPKTVTSKVKTWLSKRTIQCAGKQAAGIVKGTKTKQAKRKYQIDKFINEGKRKKARKLQQIYNKVKVSKPNVKNIQPELDSRFVKIDLNNQTSFDGWLILGSLGNKLKLILPFKKSKHFNKMLKRGKIKRGIRLSENYITFMFDIENPKQKESGNVVGIDIGQNFAISCSNGFQSGKDCHHHDLNSITERLCRKVKGSKGFKKVQSHRKNYINWTINQLDLTNVKQINIENIKNLRKGKRSSKKLNHWTYKDIFDKVENFSCEFGVQVYKKDPTYTSQRCSSCGWTRKTNRKGSLFKCGKCDFTLDADLNAARNIGLPLPEIFRKQRLQQKNRSGFYWYVEEQENIVPVVHKP